MVNLIFRFSLNTRISSASTRQSKETIPVFLTKECQLFSFVFVTNPYFKST